MFFAQVALWMAVALGPGDIGPGSCTPDVLYPGEVTTCEFPLLVDAELAADGGPYLAEIEGPFDTHSSKTCEISGDVLRCPWIDAPFAAGTFTVDVTTGFVERAREVATLEVLDFDTAPYAVGVSPLTAFFAGEPIRIEAFELEVPIADGMFTVVRDAFDGTEIDRVPLIDRLDSYEIEVTIEEPGMYRLSGCVGSTARGCEERTGGDVIAVVEPELRELVDGHNLLEADRINLVFVGSGFASLTEFAELARTLISYDGEPLLVDLNTGELTEEVGRSVDAEFGLFAIEPFRSMRDRFNLWYLADQVPDRFSLRHGPDFDSEHLLDTLGLDALSTVTLVQQGPNEFLRSQAEQVSFTGAPGPPEREELLFGSSFTAIRLGQRYLDADTLVHELGHALFDLRDEYVEFGDDAFTRFGFPNCAESPEQAERWWGTLIGEVDPFYYQYVATLDGLGIDHSPGIEDDLRVGFITGGCYGQDDEAVRPTEDSLMNSQVPVLGSVNRQRVEEILRLFSGRRTLTFGDLVREMADLASFECDPSGWVGETVTCGGSFPPYIDLPDDAAIRVRLGPEAIVECAIEAAAGERGAAVSCPAVPTGETEGVRTLVASAAAIFNETGVAVEVNAPPPPQVELTGVVFDALGRLAVSVDVIEDGRQDEIAIDLVPDGDETLSVRRIVPASSGRVLLGVADGTDEICASTPDGASASCLAVPFVEEETLAASSGVSLAAILAFGLAGLLLLLAAVVLVFKLVGRRASADSGS